MDEASIAVITAMGTTIAGLAAAVGKMALDRRNVPTNNNARRLYKNPHDPDKIPLGDVTVGWWQREMGLYTKEIVKAVEDLTEVVKGKAA